MGLAHPPCSSSFAALLCVQLQLQGIAAGERFEGTIEDQELLMEVGTFPKH